MADIADQAADYQQSEIDYLLAKRKQMQHKPISTHCDVCGDSLEKHRMEFGMCIDCAKMEEFIERNGRVGAL